MKNRKENDASSSIHDLDSPSLEDKRQKEKIQGRRLRKVMVNDDGEEDDEIFDAKSDLSTVVSEFKSHNPVKKNGKMINGVGQSRNILSALRSLFEKEKHPTKQLAIPSDSVINERLIEQKAAKISENVYVENTKPSFASNRSDSSLKVAATMKEHTDGRYAKNQVRKGLSTESFIRHQQNKNVKDNDDDGVYDDDDRHGKLGQDSDESKDSSSVDEVPFSLNHPKFSFSLPSKIANKLYPHQLEGLKWLWFLHCKGKGGILADDMGLGKTMLICGFLAGLFHSNLIKRVLIVVPKTLLPHWMKELGMVDLSGKTRVYAGTCATARQYELQRMLQDKGVLLTTYDIVCHNVKSLSDAVTWDYMILDEGHLIKNPRTKRAKSLQAVPCAHRIIISGTPLQNNLKELWALFNFCCPDLLGNKKRFKDNYEKPILRGNNKNAFDRQKLIGSVAAQGLRNHIQPYFLRRLKTDVFREDGGSNTAKVSKKNEIIVWLRLSSYQRQLYEAFLNKRSVLYDSPLPAITILKKICDHPLLITKRAAEDVLEGMESGLNQEDNWVAKKLAMHIADVAAKYDVGENHDSLSCKISFIMSLLDNLIPEGHHVLIFSQTRQMLNLLQDTLNARGYKFLRIDGTTKASDRIKIVNDFQEGIGAPIFLLTSKVGGLGLTLTKADRVIVVDPAWNPSTDSQSVDRAYRIGQKKDVIVYRLMTCGTVEEKIYRTQIYKAGLFKSATEHKDQTRYFSYQDLKDLFSLPEQGFDISLTQQQLNEEHDHKYKMDSSLEAHMKFLESLGIAGISHHSLLFSKTSPVPVLRDEELTRIRQSIFRNASVPVLRESLTSARFAFNRKDVARRKNMSRNVNKLSESKIKQINCMSQAYANKAVEARLQKHLAKLSSELHKLRMIKLRYYLKFLI